MANLIIETGVKEYSLNDVVTVKFNPTDMNFVKRFYEQIKGLEDKVKGYDEAFKKAVGTEDIFKLTDQGEEDVRAAINGLFNVDIVTPLIGDASVFSYAGGSPIWWNICTTLGDLVERETKEEQKKSRVKIAKYTAKYKNGSKYHS